MSLPCKHCSSVEHTSFYCFKKHRKPIAASSKPLKRTRLKKVGPVTRKWIATRAEWIASNPGPWHCYICSVPLTQATMQLDHIKSRSRHPELRYVLSNLAPCCGPCNAAKGSKDIESDVADMSAAWGDTTPYHLREHGTTNTPQGKEEQ